LKILVASTNQGKLNELRAMLDADVQWVGLSDFEGMAEIEEDGATFAEKLEFMKVRAVTVCPKAGIGIEAGH